MDAESVAEAAALAAAQTGLKRSSNEFIAGGIAGACGVVAGQPLDTVRVRQQTACPAAARQPAASGGLALLRSIAAGEGVRQLFRGLTYPLLAAALQNAVVFQSYGTAGRLLQQLEGQQVAPQQQAQQQQRQQQQPQQPQQQLLSLSQVFWAGCAAGMVQTVGAVPVELLKVRLQLQTAVRGQPGYVGPLSLLRRIWRTEGLRGLYRGTVVTCIRDCPSYGVYFGVYEACREWFEPGSRAAGSDSLLALWAAGGLGGAVSWLSVYPFDVVKTRCQAAGAAQSPYSGWWSCAVQSYCAEGWQVFFRGLGTTLGRAFCVVPASRNATAMIEPAWEGWKPLSCNAVITLADLRLCNRNEPHGGDEGRLGSQRALVPGAAAVAATAEEACSQLLLDDAPHGAASPTSVVSAAQDELWEAAALTPAELAELAAKAAACPDGPLAFAARRRLLPLLRALLAARAGDPNRPSRRCGRTPCMLAATSGDAVAVRALLQAGACANAKDSHGATAMHCAAFNGHAAVVQVLIEHGVALDVQDADGWTPVVLAAGRGHAAVVRQLASAGANLDLKHSEDGSTALMRAAWRGHAAVISELIAAGAAVDQRDSHGLTALAAAACAGHPAVVAQLAEAGGALDCPDSQQWTPLMWAADKGHTRTVQLLASLGARLDARGLAGETPILLAARGGHAEAALALALAGAEPDSRDAEGVCPLMAATAGGHSAAVLALVAAGATLSLLPPLLLQRAMQLLGQQCKALSGWAGVPTAQPALF
ncbi:mitochondrial arginine transporter BAC2-like [Chlorella sorokiniana]|uniref:Mitochondrial arginine transporter BAC2-like n=1 Tax=Chlorella sorokiniana TaxID=3076 RepID=A0A2P6U0G6_CHLSO|nr:mitochondrial arginine transporter BAC2-like [Chlorella sorokiniana]|eukprot:PRW59812.1 mitochondrial arginine transporter BAC2-like [Chlorella sorokiniana]